MDRYEFKLKIDQIKALVDKHEYEMAVEIADSINWKKIKNVNHLILAGDAYSRAKRYDEAHQVLLSAYDRSPIGRMIIYRLAELAIKMKDFEAAEEYYDEFLEIAPKDNLKYVLRYKLAKAKGMSLDGQILILEELKIVEYSEEWAFELARLYHRNNQIEKCIEVCDELVLWFGCGNFVKKAMDLKMLYQPLSKEQEEKYKCCFQESEEIKDLAGKKLLKEKELSNKDTSRFDTMNMQTELAKNLKAVMDEGTDTKEVSTKESLEEAPVKEMTLLDEPTSIDEMLSQWEKTKQEAEQAIAEALRKKEEQDQKSAGGPFDEEIGLHPFVPNQFLTEEEESTSSSVEKFDTKELPKIAEIEFEESHTIAEVITKLDDSLKEIFSYFVPVAGMENQICQVLTGASAHFIDAKNSSKGHILIQGGAGCGKTVLATSIVKALQKKINHPTGKIGKIDAKVLNKKDLTALLKKIDQGCLIIEHASEISKETAVKLSILLEQPATKVLLILEDTRLGIEEVMGKDESFTKKFTEKIKIPVFTSDELVAFAKAYANDLDYEIEEMAVLALYKRISNIQRVDRATTLVEVKDIVDEAIEHVEKHSLKKAFSILTSRRYNEEDFIMLREKDFEE